MGIHPVSSKKSADPGSVLFLDAATVGAALTSAKALAALENAYRGLATAPEDAGQSLGFQATDGKFHVKAGLLPGSKAYFAAKLNANFPMNAVRSGLPTIQGLVLLAAGHDGRPLAVLHSGELTSVRTAAATALAAKHGALPNAGRLAIIGCGAQAQHQTAALAAIRPLDAVVAVDLNPTRAEAFVAWAGATLGIAATVASSVASALRDAEIAVTCTTATEAFVTASMIAPGCFIAAVGADNPDKQEIAPDLFAKSRIIVDDLDQCATSGDLAHAIRAGTVSRDAVTGSLADLAAGTIQARLSPEDIVIFDSTGTGVQDVAAAAAAYEAALEDGRGQPFNFAA